MKKINWIDITLIVFVLGGILVILLKVGGNQSTGGDVSMEMNQASIVIKVDNVREATVSSLKIDEPLVSDETNSFVGRIIDLEAIPYKDKIETLDGNLVFAEVPERYTIFVTVNANLLERDAGYYADGISEIKINSDFRFYTKHVITSGKIERIDWP
jgi:hypothetical protein